MNSVKLIVLVMTGIKLKNNLNSMSEVLTRVVDCEIVEKVNQKKFLY